MVSTLLSTSTAAIHIRENIGGQACLAHGLLRTMPSSVFNLGNAHGILPDTCFSFQTPLASTQSHQVASTSQMRVLLCSCRAGIDLAKILGLIVVGMPVTLLVTAQVAITIRKFSETEMEPPEPQAPAGAFSRLHHTAWGATWVLSLAAVAFSSSAQVCAVSNAGRPQMLAIARMWWVYHAVGCVKALAYCLLRLSTGINNDCYLRF